MQTLLIAVSVQQRGNILSRITLSQSYPPFFGGDVLTTNFDIQLSKAVALREAGHFERAINLFTAMLTHAQTNAQNSRLRAHLGLAYLGTGDVDMAEACFTLAYKKASSAQSVPLILEAKRHLVRVQLLRGNYKEGHQEACALYDEAKALGRKDLAWFAHLAFLSGMHISRKEALQWLRAEVRAYSEFEVLDKNTLAKRAWRTAIVFDALAILKPLTTPLFYLGLVVVKIVGPKRLVPKFVEAIKGM